MSEYAVRVTVQVERRDEEVRGVKESLDLSFADFVETNNPAAAARVIAPEVGRHIEEQLA